MNLASIIWNILSFNVVKILMQDLRPKAMKKMHVKTMVEVCPLDNDHYFTPLGYKITLRTLTWRSFSAYTPSIEYLFMLFFRQSVRVLLSLNM